MAQSILRYRAKCHNDNYRGPWRSIEDDAYEDGRKHRQIEGNETHHVEVITKQA
ncbi:hypothetical protein ES705_29468 [subsurface metagenome]